VVDLASVIVALRTDIAGARATSAIVAVRLHSAIVRSRLMGLAAGRMNFRVLAVQ